MTAPFRAASLKPVAVECTPAPVLNILTSMAHLEDAAHMLQGVPDGYLTERPDELDAWLVEAAAQMSDEEHAFNRVLFRALGAVVLPEQEFDDFPAYLATLEASHPEALRNRALAQFRAAPGDILANFERYQGVVAERYPNDPPDTALLAEAYALLCTPEALHQRAVAHLRRLWNGLFAAEWKRREKALGALARVLAERQIPQASAPEIVRAVIGREPSPATTALLAQAECLVIVPTPHVSLYASSFHTPATVWVFVAVSTITSWALRQTPIKLSEVMVRVTPLSDETRLRILELLAQHGELSAQDLISMLDISQSSVSRHLKALGAYVVERRGEGAAKHYRLNLGHLDWTYVILRRFLSAASDHAAPPATANLAENLRGFAPTHGRPLGPASYADARERKEFVDLRRFMDREGRIAAFPTRSRDQLMVLAYLADKLEMGRFYTEREINDVIRAQLDPRYDDFVTLRRELYNFQFIGRERDGSRYWKLERATDEQ